jgi:cytochrome c oxidase subunit 2
MTDWLGLPELAAAHGGQIDGLIGWIHVFMLVLFVGWGGFLVYCLVRFRRSRNPVADYAGVRSHTSTYSEIGVVVVEAVLLIGFAIPLWAARVGAMPPENEALVVQVTARDDVTTLNQLYLPVNRPIIVRLRSKDVIHSFGVPELRVKQDAIPGLTIPIWFVPTVTTADMRTRMGNPDFQYEIACAQLCGLGHAAMRGFVTVQAAEEFQAWMEARITEQSAPDPFGTGSLP